MFGLVKFEKKTTDNKNSNVHGISNTSSCMANSYFVDVDALNSQI